MVCIYCGSKTQVNNSRPSGDKHQIWRRRSCLSCNAVFTTHETVDLANSLRVKTVAGSLEAFSRDKLFLTVHQSLMHRKTATADAGRLCDTIIDRLVAGNRGGVLQTSFISAVSSQVLGRFDGVAGSVYSARYRG